MRSARWCRPQRTWCEVTSFRQFWVARFSAALTLGGGYILFQEKPELQRLSDRSQNYSERLNSRLSSVEQMNNVVGHGWFDYNNGKEIGNVILELVKDRTEPSLDPALLRNYMEWDYKSLLQLKEEFGKIKGLFFRNNTLQEKRQSIVLQKYGSAIEMLQMIGETLGKRNHNYDNERAFALFALLPAGEYSTGNGCFRYQLGSNTSRYGTEQEEFIQFGKLERDDLRNGSLEENCSYLRFYKRLCPAPGCWRPLLGLFLATATLGGPRYTVTSAP